PRLRSFVYCARCNRCYIAPSSPIFATALRRFDARRHDGWLSPCRRRRRFLASPVPGTGVEILHETPHVWLERFDLQGLTVTVPGTREDAAPLHHRDFLGSEDAGEGHPFGLRGRHHVAYAENDERDQCANAPGFGSERAEPVHEHDEAHVG